MGGGGERVAHTVYPGSVCNHQFCDDTSQFCIAQS